MIDPGIETIAPSISSLPPLCSFLPSQMSYTRATTMKYAVLEAISASHNIMVVAKCKATLTLVYFA